jgi:hypothetical protein
MQGITAITAIKVPEKHEPKNANEFGTFDRAMTKLLAIAAHRLRA